MVDGVRCEKLGPQLWRCSVEPSFDEEAGKAIRQSGLSPTQKQELQAELAGIKFYRGTDGKVYVEAKQADKLARLKGALELIAKKGATPAARNSASNALGALSDVEVTSKVPDGAVSGGAETISTKPVTIRSGDGTTTKINPGGSREVWTPTGNINIEK